MPSEVESVNKKGVDAKDQLQLKPRVLVVDDSKVLRKAAEKILGKEFDVLVACDGEEGWEKFVVDEKIQIVFSDLSMPQLDGYGLLDRIRHSDNQRISDIPVIVITGGEAEEAGDSELDDEDEDMVEAMLKAQGLDLAEDELDDAISSLIDDLEDEEDEDK